MIIDPNSGQKQFGEVIRTRRKESGYSQEAFAFRCGVHRTYMGAIERGERNLTLKNIIRIANALELKPSSLLSLAGL